MAVKPAEAEVVDDSHWYEAPVIDDPVIVFVVLPSVQFPEIVIVLGAEAATTTTVSGIEKALQPPVPPSKLIL